MKTLAQEIKITPLETNPGILPFYLGNTRIKQSSHEFIHYFDIIPIKTEIDKIMYRYNDFNKILEIQSNSKYKYLFTNYKNQVAYQIQLIKTKFLSVYPFEQKRSKRGLINALGSVIKFISGNLDHNDAVRYDNAIKELSENQDKIVNSYNKQISLNYDLINSFNETYSLIKHNENVIIEKIKESLKTVNQIEFDFNNYLKLRDIIDQVANSLNSLIHFLSDLENAITFAKLNTLHHSILKLHEIQIIIKRLLTLYENNQLIFYEHNDLYHYYNLIKVKSYYSNARLVFVLEIPIVNPNLFNYYHLYSIPTSNLTTLIPNNPYLATYEGLFQYQAEECQRIDTVYYCDDPQVFQFNQHEDCITAILSSSEKTKCEYTKLSLNSNIIEEINSKHYILIFLSESEIQINCGKRDIINLKDTNLIELPLGCSFTYNHTNFINLKSSIESQPLLLPKINVPQFKDQPQDILDINLSKISFDKLAEIKNNQHKLEIKHNFNEYVTGHYIIFFVLIIIVIAILLSYQYFTKCKRKNVFKKRRATESKEAQREDQEMKILPQNFHS